mgnify:CR=1 FL=1
MSDEQKYTIQGLDEYIRQGEPQKRERSEAWKVAIGLQQVDRLQTSEYLLDTAKRHIEGDISINEAKQLIDSYYKSASGRKVVENDRTEEADKVNVNVTEKVNATENVIDVSQKTSQKTSQKIIDLIKEDPYISTSKMAEIIGVDRRNIARNIKKLQEQGVVRRVGPDKGGFWEVIV